MIPSEQVGLSSRELRSSFGRFPTGVVAVCALGPGARPVGLAANSFTSVSLAPALVSVNFALTSKTWPTLRECGELGLSVLGHDQRLVSSSLASPQPDSRFQGVEWRRGDPSSAAVFVKGAVVWIEVRLQTEIPAGDHVIAVMQVHAVRTFADRHPLVFYQSGYRALQPPPSRDD